MSGRDSGHRVVSESEDVPTVAIRASTNVVVLNTAVGSVKYAANEAAFKAVRQRLLADPDAYIDHLRFG